MPETDIRVSIGAVISGTSGEGAANVLTGALRIESEADAVAQLGAAAAGDGRAQLRGWVVEPGKSISDRPLTTRATGLWVTTREHRCMLVYSRSGSADDAERDAASAEASDVANALQRASLNTTYQSEILGALADDTRPGDLAGLAVWATVVTVRTAEYRRST
jgi:hypothetical protein